MTLNKVLLVAAVLCLAVAFILTVGWVDGSNPSAWGYGGFTLGFASFLP